MIVSNCPIQHAAERTVSPTNCSVDSQVKKAASPILSLTAPKGTVAESLGLRLVRRIKDDGAYTFVAAPGDISKSSKNPSNKSEK